MKKLAFVLFASLSFSLFAQGENTLRQIAAERKAAYTEKQTADETARREKLQAYDQLTEREQQLLAEQESADRKAQKSERRWKNIRDTVAFVESLAWVCVGE